MTIIFIISIALTFGFGVLVIIGVVVDTIQGLRQALRREP